MTNHPSAKTSITSSSLCLEDYATFQYMLAPPSIAGPIVNQIQSFVFYNEPFDAQNHTVMVQGTISLLSYYGCCLAVLPSHLLGMSQFISSSEDLPKDSQILRQFRYSYYFGLLQVDSRHMQLHDDKESSFRLVEYMDISPWAWVIAEAFFMALIAGILWSVQRFVVWFDNTSDVGDGSSSFPWTTFAIMVVAFNFFGLAFRGQYRP